MSGPEEMDVLSFFPRPVRLLLQGFQVEVHLAIKGVVDRLDLVSKDDYLVQKQLLEQAQLEIQQMKERMSSGGDSGLR